MIDNTQNNIKYWLRGIIIAIILVVVWTALGYWLNDGLGNQFSEMWNSITSFFVFIPASLTSQLLKIFCTSSGTFSCLVQGIIIIFVLALLEFVVVGAFLGWIYGKIVNRNNP